MKIVIASDSFKGTLSSKQICELFKQQLKGRKDIEAIYLPIADGGEGSLDAISSILDGQFVDVTVHDLYFQEIKTHFFVDKNKNVYIESASCVGMGLAKSNNDPGLVTTYGLGEMIKTAIETGYKNIYLFLGGTASNDGGVGLAAGLETIFYNEENKPFIPTGLTLKNIKSIDNEKTEKLLKNTAIYGLIDVNSPFFGQEGAAYKFAKQKGASDEEIILLDEGLRHLSSVVKLDINKDISTVPGSGAAGGLGGGLVAFTNAKLTSGINAILDLIEFDKIIQDADLVISGEGKLDKQTFDGKVVDGIAKRCMKMNKNLDLIVGISEVPLADVKRHYPCINNVYETNCDHRPFEEIKSQSPNDYLAQIKLFLITKIY